MVISGLLPIQYKRFVNGIGIECNSQRARKSFADDYYQYIHQEYDSSCEQAIGNNSHKVIACQHVTNGMKPLALGRYWKV